MHILCCIQRSHILRNSVSTFPPRRFSSSLCLCHLQRRERRSSVLNPFLDPQSSARIDRQLCHCSPYNPIVAWLFLAGISRNLLLLRLLLRRRRRCLALLLRDETVAERWSTFNEAGTRIYTENFYSNLRLQWHFFDDFRLLYHLN